MHDGKRTRSTLFLALAMIILLGGWFGTLLVLLKPDQVVETPRSITSEKPPQGNSFPSPAAEKGNFYAIYTVGDIQFDVTPLVTNMTNDPIHGGNIFELDYYNSAVTDVTASSTLMQQLNIGCIATNDGAYHTIKETPGIFGVNTSQKPASSAKNFTVFKSYQHQKITIEVQPACKYIGTADLKYSWLVK